MDIEYHGVPTAYMISASVVYYLCSVFGLNVYFSDSETMVVMAAFGIFLRKGASKGAGRPGPCSHSNRGFDGFESHYNKQGQWQVSVSKKAYPGSCTVAFGSGGGAVPKDRRLRHPPSSAAASCCSLFLFLKRSKWGRAIMAKAQNREGASYGASTRTRWL